ncbi:MAG: type II toxin-antitoxin system ParD family antitoxin [Proteobacteria bacterium]|nr:type II toxin-antitoxin system ParD family antitoxin [Pseudomonadota bacterium]
MKKEKQKTHTISLGDYWNSFIANQLEGGRYSSTSEIVRDALRLMEETEADSKLKALRAALIEGEESGDAGELDMKSIIDEAKNEL